jgi:hypothetical protein
MPLPRLSHPPVRLRARIKLGRIEVPALHGANRTRHVAIAGIWDALQETGNLLEERISVLHGQRSGGGEDRGELTVGQSERRHAANPRRGFRHTAEYEFRQCGAP